MKLRGIQMIKGMVLLFALVVFSSTIYAVEEFPESNGSYVDNLISDGTLQQGVGDVENIGMFIIEWTLSGLSLDSPADSLMGAFSGILNTILIAFAVMAIGKHGLQFVTLTATKGSPGGGQLSGGVIAIRSSLAIAMLAPIIGSGYSPVQLLVKEVAVVGVLIADTAVNQSMDSVVGDGKTTITTPPLEGMSDVVWNVALNETCHRVIEAYYALDAARGVIDEQANPTTFGLSLVDNTIVYSWGWKRPYKEVFRDSESTEKPAECGTVVLNIPEVLSGRVEISNSRHLKIDGSGLNQRDDLYREQLLVNHVALTNAKYAMGDLTDRLMADQGRIMEVTGLRSDSSLTADDVENLMSRISAETKNINQNMTNLSSILLSIDRKYALDIRTHAQKVATYINDNSATGDKGKTWDDSLRNQGFVGLGSYYWVILKTTMASNALQRHIVEKGAYPAIFTTHAEHEDLKFMQNLAIFKTAGQRLDKLRQSFDDQKTSITGGAMELNFSSVRNSADVANDQNKIKELFNVGAIWILDLVEDSWLKSNETDLIINMTKMGTVITSTAELLIVGIMILSIVGSLAKSNFLLSFASSLTGAGILGKIAGMLAPIVVVGLLIGVIMQYVLPAIPLIKWLVAIQSWAIMLFVAMIYAPIWMMSTAAASNEDWVNDKVKDGFIMLAELLLRPLLLVMCFFIAMKLMWVANLGAKIMYTYMIGLANEGVMGFISIVMVVVITTFVAYKLTMRSFDIVAEVPDWVIERMGGKPMGDAVKDDTANSTVLIASKATGEVTSGLKGLVKK